MVAGRCIVKKVRLWAVMRFTVPWRKAGSQSFATGWPSLVRDSTRDARLGMSRVANSGEDLIFMSNIGFRFGLGNHC